MKQEDWHKGGRAKQQVLTGGSGKDLTKLYRAAYIASAVTWLLHAYEHCNVTSAIAALSKAVGIGYGSGPSGVYTSPAQAVAKDETGAAAFGCKPADNILTISALASHQVCSNRTMLTWQNHDAATGQLHLCFRDESLRSI